MPQLKTLLLVLVFPLFIFTPIVRAQGLTGTSSLILAPTAEMAEDGTVRVHGGFLNRKYTTYSRGRYDLLVMGGTFQFLPDLETGFRFTRVRADLRQAFGDRSVSARLRLVREGRRRPAVVIGAHDFLTSTEMETDNFSALYAVGTYHVAPWGYRTGFHLGYGTRWLNARHHLYAGLFGGVSVRALPHTDVLAEYDGDRVNAGFRVTLLGRIQALVALQNLDTVAAGLSLQTKL